MAANGNRVALNGAVFLDLGRGDKKTTQMAYVSAQVKQMLLSQTACKGLGLIAKDFPKVAAQPEVAKCTATEDEGDNSRGCDCPSRVEAPDPLAYRKDAKPEEPEALIMKHYACLAFNTCERQKLLVMQGRACKMFVDPKVRPFVIDKLRLVAIH